MKKDNLIFLWIIVVILFFILILLSLNYLKNETPNIKENESKLIYTNYTNYSTVVLSTHSRLTVNCSSMMDSETINPVTYQLKPQCAIIEASFNYDTMYVHGKNLEQYYNQILSKYNICFVFENKSVGDC